MNTKVGKNAVEPFLVEGNPTDAELSLEARGERRRAMTSSPCATTRRSRSCGGGWGTDATEGLARRAPGCRDHTHICTVEYDTFETYCKARWGIERRRAYQLMDGSAVVENLRVNNCTQTPATESQARSLTKLETEVQPVVWELVVEKAGDGTITAAAVEEAVAEFLHEPSAVDGTASTTAAPRMPLACTQPLRPS